MLEEPQAYFSTDYLFNEKKYHISLIFKPQASLKLEIRDTISMNEWHAQYTSDYITELTRKTGNFKNFSIFVSMLQYVLSNKSNSLSLEFVDYVTLENLRLYKKSSDIYNIKSVSGDDYRKYLIMSYFTDFDAIHYPLPVMYVGIPDPKKLNTEISKLREELYSMQSKIKDTSKNFVDKVDLNNLAITQQNDNASLINMEPSVDINSVDFSRNSMVSRDILGIGVVENNNLRWNDIVKSLEAELTKERSERKRLTTFYKKQISELTDQLSCHRVREQKLNLRLNQLSNELDYFKRAGRAASDASSGPSVCLGTGFCGSQWRRGQPSLRRDHLRPSLLNPGLAGGQVRSSSAEALFTRRRPSLSSGMSWHRPRDFASSSLGVRAYSADRNRFTRSRPPLFDPTAYIREKELKRLEIERKRKGGSLSRPGCGVDMRAMCCGHMAASKRHACLESSSSTVPGCGRSHLVRPLLLVDSDSESCGASARHRFGRHSRGRPRASDSESEGCCQHAERQRGPVCHRRTAFCPNNSRQNGKMRRQLMHTNSRHQGRTSYRPKYTSENGKNLPKDAGDTKVPTQSESAMEDEISKIDERLDVLQNFFQNYLGIRS